ncbi:Dipeptide ABC transporter, substrate-binding protein DppA [Candidatus Syntrophocurvum alkaliphilum]|uniref:Dipeptide ABC transporter, substrate-binding protein DppA n=1 Tax=Candidatus Syntrophocurvum alkaliphilum TaxID=2293317 RepID=A0A6I6DMX6_9FIRM|nr:ABC transporter substrate-binding protein [Candidatus Syntrophocurvum alkaliphilum]QGU00368.1 Dipeptide ABC transporter, substrate-binding protein DppA [Candidatus Syntrophocurvum alkaliphilum]
MSKKKVFTTLLLLVFVFSFTLAGCGGEGTGEVDDTTIFTVARSTDADLIDPGYAWAEGDIDPVYHVFDGLLQFKNDDLDVAPALATDWEMSEDGKTWTFYLRDDVKFHDGTDFNADAVVFSFERVLDEDHPYYGVVQGGYSYLNYLMGDVITEVRAIDEFTVEIELEQKFAPFITYMAHYSQFIVSPTAVEKYGENFPQNPVGTGPFVFEDWRQGEYIRLAANDNYWGEKPEIDTLIFKVVPETSTRLMELQTGQVDAIKHIDPAQIYAVQNDDNIDLLTVPGANLFMGLINVTKEPLDDPTFRKALNHAIDMDALVDVIYEGTGTRAINALPPTVFAFDETAGPYEYDPEKAKQLLADAGYPEGTEIELASFTHARSYISQPVQVAEIIRADLQRIGLDVDINVVEWGTLTEMRQSREFDVALYGWYDVPYPSNFLRTMMLGGNQSGYEPQELVDIADQALATYDEAEQEKLYKELQQEYYEQAPIIPIAHSNYSAAVRSDIEGFQLDIMGNVLMHDVIK